MGTFGGHTLPGSFFIFFGVWWTVNIYYRYYMALIRRERFTSSATFRFLFLCEKVRHWPIEGALMVFFVVVGGSIEVLTGFDDNWHFNEIGNGQHATMFLFFGIAGMIDILMYFRLSIPKGMDYLSMSLALIVEYLLFSFHLHGREKVDVLLHTLLEYIIIATVVVVIAEMQFRHTVLLALTRAYLLILQGVWFWQVAFILYNPVAGAIPWNLHDHKNMMIATLRFAWQAAIVLALMLAAGGLVKCYVTRRHGPIDDEVMRDNRASAWLISKDTAYTELSIVNESESDTEFEKTVVCNQKAFESVSNHVSK